MQGVVAVWPSSAAQSTAVSAGSGSSSVMVPWAWPSPTVAPTGAVRFTRNVSSSSSSASFRSGIDTVRDVWPGGKVTTPVTAV